MLLPLLPRIWPASAFGCGVPRALVVVTPPLRWLAVNTRGGAFRMLEYAGTTVTALAFTCPASADPVPSATGPWVSGWTRTASALSHKRHKHVLQLPQAKGLLRLVWCDRTRLSPRDQRRLLPTRLQPRQLLEHARLCRSLLERLLKYIESNWDRECGRRW